LILQSRVDLRAARKSLLAQRGPYEVISLAIYCKLLKARVGGQLIAAHAVAKKMSIRPPEYKPPPRRAYTNLGWIFAALTGPATLLAVWIYCAVTYGFLLGFFLGWIPALILALLVAVATIFLWPLAAVAVLYVIYRVFGVHPELLIYIAAFVGVIAIAMIWWWHVGNNKL
jgi:hypothetical protein